MGWVMGTVGKKLKRQSLDAQAKWSDTMSQLEETLGGLRIIKAFIAENKMMERFNKCSNEYRDAINRVATRQALAHPMSEFLGTCVIVIVLWFGGTLILSNSATIDAPSFIYYLVILYSVINPLKEFSKAGYNIPKGLASMERIDKLVEEQHTKSPSLTSALISRAVEYIQKHYTEPTLTVASLAENIFISREHLSRAFKEYTMESIHGYINNLRMQHFRRDIAAGHSVLDACTNSGFASYNSFLKSFRNLYGMTPTQYRAQLNSIEKRSLNTYNSLAGACRFGNDT